MRRYLRDPTFSRFDTIPECDGHTHRHTTTAYTALSKASRSKNRLAFGKVTDKSLVCWFFWFTVYIASSSFLVVISSCTLLAGYQSMPTVTVRPPPELPDFAHRPGLHAFFSLT